MARTYPNISNIEPGPEAEIQTMDAAELSEIGERLFGRVGWTVKIAKLVGKDASTLRRWRSGGPIEPIYAKIIRDYDAQHGGPDVQSWDDAVRRPDSEALRALRLVARAQALGLLGVPVGVRVSDGDEGLAITLRLSGAPPMAAWQDESGGFNGLRELEDALNKAWTHFTTAD